MTPSGRAICRLLQSTFCKLLPIAAIALWFAPTDRYRQTMPEWSSARFTGKFGATVETASAPQDPVMVEYNATARTLSRTVTPSYVGDKMSATDS